MRTIRWIRGFALALLVPWGYGVAQGTDAELHTLLREQNQYAEAYVAASVAFTNAVVAFDYLLTEADRQDPATAAALAALIDPTLTTLAQIQSENIEALIAIEDRIQELLGNDAALPSQPESVLQPVGGVVGGTLVVLGVFAGTAAVGVGVMDAWSECDAEASIEESGQFWDCLVYGAPGASLQAVITGATAVGKQLLVVLLTPWGRIKVAVQTGFTLEKLYFFGTRSCDSESDGRLPTDDTTMRVMQQLRLADSPADRYIGQADEAGVFHGVPAGEWVFVVFAPDHARAVTECVVVRENEITDLRLDLTPISDTSLDSDSEEVVDGVLEVDTCPVIMDTVPFDLWLWAGSPGRWFEWDGYYCTYSSNPNTGKSLLLQPVLVPGGEGGADFTLYFRMLDGTLRKSGVLTITEPECRVGASEITYFCGDLVFENGVHQPFNGYWNNGGP